MSSINIKIFQVVKGCKKKRNIYKANKINFLQQKVPMLHNLRFDRKKCGFLRQSCNNRKFKV